MNVYTLDDLDIDFNDLRELLAATYGVLHEMPYERDGRRDEELDRVAALVRIAQQFTERVETNLGHLRPRYIGRSAYMAAGTAEAFATAVLRRTAAYAAWDAADTGKHVPPKEPEWSTYLEAEADVFRHPCRTMEDVRIKASGILADPALMDCLKSDEVDGDGMIEVFLRSLIGDPEGAR